MSQGITFTLPLLHQFTPVLYLVLSRQAACFSNLEVKITDCVDGCGMKVLTCEWVNGEKLSESNAADLLPLVTTALNCYLVQLLETGFLHADPHPGNLLRTPDGHLCVLDFGLMTEVPSFAGILHNNGH